MPRETRRGSGAFCRARAALRGYGKNRSESSVGGGDGGSHTSYESPRRSREVVNLHTLPVCTKIAKIRRGEREPTQTALSGWGTIPLNRKPEIGEERVRTRKPR